MDRRTRIENYIGKVFCLNKDFVRTKTKQREYSDAKKMMCSVLYYKEEMKLLEVAKYMGYRDHSTVIHALKKFEAFYETDPTFRKLADQVYHEYHTITQNENQNLQHTPMQEEHLVADSNAANN